MIGIITGDIIGSRKAKSTNWIEGLKELFSEFGITPKDWEIYRGDEFQLEISEPSKVLLVAFQIKAYLKSIKLDARMSMGIGDKTYISEKISESNGSAFVFSGEGFNRLKKEKINLLVTSENAIFNLEVNLILRLVLSFMDTCTSQSAEYILIAIKNPKLSQEEIGVKLGINQAAVSRRQKRSNYELMMQVDRYFRKKIKSLEL